MIDAGPFAKALDAVEALADEQQIELIDLVQRRRIEREREQIIEDVRAARAEFERGEAKVVTVDELMSEITS